MTENASGPLQGLRVVAHSEPPEFVLQSPEFGETHDLLVEVEHPTFGEHSRMKTLVELFRGATVADPGALCGRHTDEILTERGYDAAAIADLRERKIVA